MSRPVDGAYSTTTGKRYDTWDQLIEAEANQYVVTCIITGRKGKVWPVSWGPMPKAEAEKFRARMRAKFLRDQARPWSEYAYQKYSWSVRPLWKTER